MQLNLPIFRFLIKLSVGLALLVAGYGFERPFSGQLFPQVIADGEEGQPAFDGSSRVTVVLADPQYSRQCETAKRRALEIAPELLALADWPLDDHLPAVCLPPDNVAQVAIGDPLPDVIEISGHPSIVSVVAYTVGTSRPVWEHPHSAPAVENRQDFLLDSQVAVLDSETLDGIRGGFELDGGNLRLSFGIERALFINGELVSTTVLNVKSMQQISAGGSPGSVTIPAIAERALNIVQIGSGNNVATQISPNIAGTIIQNTLDNQKIQNITTVNTTVNSLQAYRASAMQSAIQSGIVGALRR
ncbi:MAG: hypothetical protein Q8N89_06980 [Azonexus sp.]|nr:hypothetical protein [Azonexus sp.]